MSYRKAGVILFTFLFSILSGCIGTSDSTDPSERIEDANHVHVACYDDVLTNPDCNIDFSVGRGIEPMVSSILLLEFESNDYDGHNHEHFDEHTHASEPENHSIDYSPIPDFLFAKSAIETSGRSHAQAASDCSSQDLIGLENHDLENYLVTHTQGCLFQSIVIPLDFNVVSVFTDENIVWMANRIEEIAPIYDGDNSEGIFQLMYFIHEAYYHEWYGQIDEFEMGTTNAVYDAINAIKTSPHLLNPGEASRQILNKLITMSDTVDGQALLLSIYAQILDEFPDDSSFYFIDADGVPSFTQQAVFSVLYSLQRSAHYTDVNAHPQIWDVLTLIAGISTDESITNDAEYIVSNAIWAFGRFAYTTPPYSEIYWWVSVNDMYLQKPTSKFPNTEELYKQNDRKPKWHC